MELTPDGYKTWRLKKEDLVAELGNRIIAPIYILGLPGDVQRFIEWFSNIQKNGNDKIPNTISN